MFPKSLRFVLLANWIFACFLSFTVVTHWDELAPLPARSAVTVTAWDKSTPTGELRSQIEQFMVDHAITGGRLTDDFAGEQRGRTLYLAGTDPAVAEWLRDGYTDFTRSLTTRVRPFAEAGDQEPTGVYVVLGDYAEAARLGDFLSSKGLVVGERFDRWSLAGADRQLQDDHVTILNMMMLVSVAIAAAGVLMGARSYSIKRLQGLGYASLLLSDVRHAARYWLTGGALIVGATTGFLLMYNGLAAFGSYLLTTLAIGCVLAVAAVGTHALALSVLMRLSVAASVKGELPARTASVVAYTLRVATVIATVVLVERAVATGLDIERREDALTAYTQLGSTSRIGLGSVWSAAEEKQATSVVGAWLRTEDRAGHLILAGRELVQDMGPLRGRDLLYVNDNFLREQPIRLADGAKPAVGEPTLFIPADLWNDRDAVAPLLPSSMSTVEFKQAMAASRQQVFTYTSKIDGPTAPGVANEDHSLATDPIVVFLPSQLGLLDGESFTAFATQGRVLFPNPQVVRDAIGADPGLRRFVVSVTPAATEAATAHNEVIRKFQLTLFGAAAGVLVLLVTGIGAVQIHTRRNAQLIFARHVSGWRFTATHRMLLAFEAAVLVVLVGWLPYQVWRVNSELAVFLRRGMIPPFDPVALSATAWVAISLLAALTVCGALAALIRAHHRMVRAGASEA
ncbi:hypothetical protein JOF56_002477 [Kibdelosporangium banguiense]|uniref:ABC transport system permease protein n=1 Tax=Kibdelosporangium banguiense TaxID=1365924 RepID=A0ABS4TCF1_9PSEU|nr:hypothetical protein [Kibdelosporangium banguiense]MBP2322092.1 hypothetical protein [Kibdelosporangium banguiense]